MMGNDVNYGCRIAGWRKANGLSQREFAEKAGVSRSFLGDIESGRSEPSRNFLQSLSNAFLLNPAWILEGQEPVILTVDRSMLGVPMSDFVQVRYERASPDAPMEEWGEYAFSSAWLRDLNVSHGGCRLMRIPGNDMDPTLPPGTVILIDSDRQQPNGGIFAFRLAGNLLIRRLAVIDGMVSITADNRAYSSMAAPLDRMDILGQAVWQSSLLLEKSK